MALADDVRMLVDYAVNRAIIGEDDRAWAYNRLLGALHENGPEPVWEPADARAFDLEGTMNRLGRAGVAAGLEEDTPSGRDRVET